MEGRPRWMDPRRNPDRLGLTPESIEELSEWRYPVQQRGGLVESLRAAGASFAAASNAVDKELPAAVALYRIGAKRDHVKRTPAEVRAELEEIEKASARLLELLGGISIAAYGAIQEADSEVATATGIGWMKSTHQAGVALVVLWNSATLARAKAALDSGAGRPRKAARRDFVDELARTWRGTTGQDPTASVGGAFWRFAVMACGPVFPAGESVTDNLIKDAATRVRGVEENPA